MTHLKVHPNKSFQEKFNSNTDFQEKSNPHVRHKNPPISFKDPFHYNTTKYGKFGWQNISIYFTILPIPNSVFQKEKANLQGVVVLVYCVYESIFVHISRKFESIICRGKKEYVGNNLTVHFYRINTYIYIINKICSYFLQKKNTIYEWYYKRKWKDSSNVEI
jgi:hypothetical protein